jgi:hypothetical protein
LIADVPRARLSELAARFGDGLGEDAARCEALLAEACGDGFGEECAALVAAVEQGIAGDLLRGRHGNEPPRASSIACAVGSRPMRACPPIRRGGASNVGPSPSGWYPKATG